MILDTNALSAFADDHPRAVAEIEKAQRIAIPVIVLGEFWFGIAQSRNRVKYERWIEDTLPVSRVLEVDTETAVQYAEVRLELKRAGTPIPTNDGWIAALCRQHDLSLLSQDKHFDCVRGLRRVEW